MHNVIHVDEKWFNGTKDKRSYLVFDGGHPSLWTRQSKRYVPKIIYDPHRKCTWDGKLGVWPVTEKYVAQRSSPYRPRGAICTRNIEAEDRSVYKTFLLQFHFPARLAHRPGHNGSELRGRLEYPTDVLLLPNSPDMNVLDLDLFASLQSLQCRVSMRGTDDIIRAVFDAFQSTTSETLDNIFLTLQDCMWSVLAVNGSNQYTLPHTVKDKLKQAGTLPVSLQCEWSVYGRAVKALKVANNGRPPTISKK
ncbi:Hypothetical protein PHPALM_12991 [Phytophthora palmivora]|uniref:Uncharacterized protein n=1 Tax=Phytophthora palmivora TaxID=4796 RepID=A0A2P4XYC0_9STRA|nr:Hypothetical protein PHPALM_12991 [Phytophthora palmivora]